MTVEIGYTGSNNVLTIPALTSGVDDTAVNNATVTATLVDASDVEVSGQSWPLTLAYVAASDGVYRGTLESDISVTRDTAYMAKVTAISGGLTKYWELPVVFVVDTTVPPLYASVVAIAEAAGVL